VAALALAVVVLGLRRGFAGAPAGTVVAVTAALLAVAGALVARPGRLAGPRVALAAVAAGALVLAVAAGARVKHRFDARGYHGADPTIDWVLARAPSGARIGLAGIFDPAAVPPVLPVFGPRLRNDVRYVGPWVGHRLEQYAAATPFRAALRAGRYELLLVGRGTPPADVVPAERWAMAGGWVPVARGPAMTLLLAPTARSL
jgi:hypothetical protein